MTRHNGASKLLGLYQQSDQSISIQLKSDNRTQFVLSPCQCRECDFHFILSGRVYIYITAISIRIRIRRRVQ